MASGYVDVSLQMQLSCLIRTNKARAVLYHLTWPNLAYVPENGQTMSDNRFYSLRKEIFTYTYQPAFTPSTDVKFRPCFKNKEASILFKYCYLSDKQTQSDPLLSLPPLSRMVNLEQDASKSTAASVSGAFSSAEIETILQLPATATAPEAQNNQEQGHASRRQDNETLQREHATLQQELQGLKEAHDILRQDHSTLQQAYLSLQYIHWNVGEEVSELNYKARPATPFMIGQA